jgi:hypothetical protein
MFTYVKRERIIANLLNALSVIESCSQEIFLFDTLPPKPKRKYTKRTQKEEIFSHFCIFFYD